MLTAVGTTPPTLRRSVIPVLVSLLLVLTWVPPPAAHASGQAPASHPTFDGGYLYPTETTNVTEGAGWLDQGDECPDPSGYLPGHYHLGVDFPLAAGSPVYAIADGEVLWHSDDWDKQGNKGVPILHRNADGTEFVAIYGHIRSGLSVGAKVSAGEQIGTIGPFSGGDHLHFGVNPGGRSSWPRNNQGFLPCSRFPDTNGFVDPLDYLQDRCPATDGRPASVSTAIIIDSSGSMSWNDPFNLRLGAARSYVANSKPDDEIGVVDFDSNARIVSEAVTVGPNRNALRAAIEGIGASGGTHLGRGLDAGFDVLSCASGEERLAIFLTDGIGTYTDEAAQYADAGWKVFTVGLGSGIPEQLLQQIADETGGQYIQAADASTLVCEFRQIREIALGAERTSCEATDVIANGQSFLLQPAAITTQRDLLNATITSVGPLQPQGDLSVQPLSRRSATTTSEPAEPELRMTLTSPTGREINRDTVADDVIIETGSGFESISILNPELGTWEFTVTGRGIPEGFVQPFAFFTSSIESDLPDDPDGPDESEGADGSEEDGEQAAPSPPPPVLLPPPPPAVDTGDDGDQPGDEAGDDEAGDAAEDTPPVADEQEDASDDAGEPGATEDADQGILEAPDPDEPVEVLPELTEQCTLDAPDVDESNVHFDDICALVADGVILGFDDGTIRPSSAVSRGQFATVIARELGVDGGDVEVASFADTAASAHAGSIEALFELGIVDGFEDGTFGPGQAIRRDQAASMLAAWLELEPVVGDRFSDVAADNVHAGSIYALEQIGVIEGTSDTTFGPTDEVRRDQFFALVNRAR